MRQTVNVYLFIVNVVSIHASVKDATKQARKFKDGFSGFNPRICKRCDCINKITIGFKRVSIHASVKDATVNKNGIRFQVDVSIHASVKDAT